MDQSIQDLKRKNTSAPKRENSACSPHIKIKLLKNLFETDLYKGTEIIKVP